MEEFKEMWNRQKEFNKVFFDSKNKTKEEKEAYTKEMILHLISEADEVLNETNWKMHRKKNIDVRMDRIKEELVDLFKYSLILSQIWYDDPSDFFNEFNRKSEVVEQKYKQEFSLGLLEDKKVVAVDIDGVLCNYPEDFIKFAEEKSGNNLKKIKLKDYNLYDLLSNEIGEDKLKEIKHEFRLSGQKRFMSVIEGAKNGLSYLRSKGYTIVLLTARPYKQYPRMFADTMEWLKKNELPFDAILWDENKEEKIIKEFPSLNFMIEDLHTNANKIARKGYKVFLLKKEYNESKEINQNVIRVKNWNDIIKKLEDQNG